MNVLGTAPARTSWSKITGLVRARRVVEELAFLDFTVDTVPLRELVTDPREPPNPAREMTRLCEAWPEEAEHGLRRLLGEEPADFAGGRVALLVCPIDADLGCAAVSAALARGDGWVEWRDLGWQVSHEPFDVARNRLDPPMSFRFEADAYDLVLRDRLEHFRGLAARRGGAPADRRWPNPLKRRSWPRP
ncbi:MAG: hypothetical protein QOD91_1208 [Frankiales bacterium]|nr:hypothetical protein [Frankiales bacterium]